MSKRERERERERVERGLSAEDATASIVISESGYCNFCKSDFQFKVFV